MPAPPLTPCECAESGWCARHRCWKAAHWHLLCRRHQAYFDAWERGEGPCMPLEEPPEQLPSPECDDVASAPGERITTTGPSLLQRARHFGSAIVRHVADRARCLDDAGYDKRLAVCRECPSCDTTQMICRDKSCGCFLSVKARWRSEMCPQNRWPEEEPQPHE